MVARSFFPRGLNPVLDGGVGDEDFVVAPEVPGSGPVRQAVLDDQAYSPLLHAAGVQALGQGQVGQIHGETAATAEATMPREGNNHIDGLLGPGVAEVMQGPSDHSVTTGAADAARAAPRRVVAAAPFHPWLRKIFNAGDSLRDIRHILAWPVHLPFS
jgi:hypothetical protein